MKKKFQRWFPNYALKNLSILTSGKFISYLSGFSYSVFSAYILGAEGLGQLVLIISVVKLFSMPFNFKLTHPVTKLIKERISEKLDIRNRDIIKLSLLIQGLGCILFGSIFLFFLWFGSPWFDLFQDWQIALALYAMSEVVYLFRRPLGAILVGFEKFGWSTAYGSFESLCRDLIPILLMFTYGIQGACFGYIIAEIIISVFFIFLLSRVWGKQAFRAVADSLKNVSGTIKKIFENTRSSYFSKAISTTYQELQNLILGGMVGPAGVGFYNIGLKFQKIFSFLSSPLKTYLFPRLVKKWNSNKDEFYYTLRKYFYQFIPTSILTAAILCLSAPWLVPLFYSESFIPSIPVVWILLPPLAIQSSFNIFKQMTFVISQQRSLINESILRFITGLPINVILIYYFGYLGAAASTAILSIITICYQLYFYHKNFGWKWIIPA